MGIGWSWSWELRGAKGAWVAGTLFFTAGIVMAVAVPSLMPEWGSAPGFGQPAETAFIFRLLGWSFVALGGTILGLMAAGWLVRRGRPKDLSVWHWWVGFVGGLLGALMFAVPATLAFPLLYALNRREPGGLFPRVGPAGEHLWIGVLFSLLGLAVLVVVAVVARVQLASRPRWSAGGPAGGARRPS